MNIKKWLNENTHNLKGTTIAITGSTGEIANYVVSVLASLDANFIFINRNKKKTEKQINELISLYPNIKIEFVPCDLSNFESVRSATDILKQKHIDIQQFKLSWTRNHFSVLYSVQEHSSLPICESHGKSFWVALLHY